MAQPLLPSGSANGLISHGDEINADETAPLVSPPTLTTSSLYIVPAPYAHRVLFLSFSASVAIAATAATTVYAYAFILCKDPTHCQDGEDASYAGATALATVIANGCGILALGPLQKIMKPRPKAVLYKSIALALVGRIFEGFATDNLLHFILSSIYISAGDTKKFSQLMGTSLGLYMLGMFSSPIIAGLLPSFFTSFIMALSVFFVSVVYIAFLVPVVRQPQMSSAPEPLSSASVTIFSGLRSIIGPLVGLFSTRGSLLVGLALLFFNMSQAYLFTALMVFGSLRFSFTGKQNGFLISIAAGVSAIYLLIVSHGIPKLRNWRKKHDPTEENVPSEEVERFEGFGWRRSWNWDFFYAILSMLVQIMVLPCIAFTTAAWQVFAFVGLLALGLAAPSFIKSYGATLIDDGPAAVASWAMMESLGGLLSALVLGGWQNLMGVESVFFVAAGLVGIAAVLVIIT
ncbi:MFS general substrate transporter [Nemania sp. FL0916]|nr:MFS general substrate transporter [Nemania sp. FL0916]